MSGPWERYAAPQGPWAKYAADKPESSLVDGVKRAFGNAAAGLVRGAGSIGATILSPLDAAARAINGGQPVSVGGVEVLGQDRRAGMDAALQEMGADPKSAAFQASKLVAEVAGTAGVGGALAKAAALVPGSAAVAPLLEAIGTGGMSAGGLSGAAGLVTRAAGGAVTGGASTGLINPADAGQGAVIGAALPGAMLAAAKVGAGARNLLSGGAQAPEMAAAVKAAQQAGYVIPPSQANPTLANRLMEGVAGKVSTAQNASARNQAVTNDLAAKAIGLPKGTQITPEVLDQVRQTAAQAYEAVSALGELVPGKAYDAALNKLAAQAVTAAKGFPNAKPSPVLDLVNSLRSPSFDASSAVAKIKELRSGADDAFRTGSTDVARAMKGAATALEDVIEAHLKATGQPELLTAFRDSRRVIAKTYTIEKALNTASGSVDAKKLAQQLQKGKPLSDELKTAAEFAARFPKAAQTPEVMGSLPQMSPLDVGAAAGLSTLLQSPLALASVALRPAARAAALSGPVQSGLIQTPGVLAALPSQAFPAIYRAAPVIGASSDR